jgi:hypothetical protein
MKNRSGEALLVDPGSPGNLTGDEWSERMADAARRAGVPEPVHRPLDRVLEVGGVGSGSQRATHSHQFQIVLPGGEAATYEAPVLPNSNVPALLGRQSLRDQRTLVDCFNNRLYRIGPGGYSLQLSPGSAQYELEESHAGHLMLPCDLYEDLATTRSSGSTRTMALTTSTAEAAASPTSQSSRGSAPTQRTPRGTDDDGMLLPPRPWTGMPRSTITRTRAPASSTSSPSSRASGTSAARPPGTGGLQL